MKKKLMILLCLATMAAFTACSGNEEPATKAETTAETDAKVEETKAQEPETDAVEMTMGERNALAKADVYFSTAAFSYTGIIEQLEFEGFTTEEATFAADHCGADWNEQAAKKAEAYLDISSFSREGLIEQLEFDGFTTEQAEYGATAVGY